MAKRGDPVPEPQTSRPGQVAAAENLHTVSSGVLPPSAPSSAARVPPGLADATRARVLSQTPPHPRKEHSEPGFSKNV